MRAMQVVTTRAELAAALATLPGGAARAFVPTMGALHAGHASLVDVARAAVGPDGAVVVSIFVNPLQFGPNEDLSRYPRDLPGDVSLLESLGVDLVWTPTVDDMYPPEDPIPTVKADARGSILEGASRPGHFDGVLTVVNLLFDLVRPGIAVFGQKDYQQLVLIQSLARTRGDVAIIGAPLVRDADGLALSSRNAYLSVEDRQHALAIPRAIAAAVDTANSGASAETAVAIAESVLDAEPGINVDYVVVLAEDLQPVDAAGPARILIAARVGGVRLLDNAALDLKE